jgi:hypothetical protein
MITTRTNFLQTHATTDFATTAEKISTTAIAMIVIAKTGKNMGGIKNENDGIL